VLHTLAYYDMATVMAVKSFIVQDLISHPYLDYVRKNLVSNFANTNPAAANPIKLF
jgi:hypothetical protein